MLHFNRWCTASEVDNFESLCDLILLEQFKTAVPQQIATYIGEKEVKTVAEAAALADDYTLMHKVTFGEPRLMLLTLGSGEIFLCLICSLLLV